VRACIGPIGSALAIVFNDTCIVISVNENQNENAHQGKYINSVNRKRYSNGNIKENGNGLSGMEIPRNGNGSTEIRD
jgi:hypothetical protein